MSRIPGTNLLIIANLGYTKKLCNGICHVFVREDGSLSWVTRLMKHRPVSADMPKFRLTSSPLSIFPTLFNSSPPGQNGHYFTGDSFMCIFVNEKFCIWISLKFVPKGPIDNNRAMVDNSLAPNRRQAIIWTKADHIHWRIYAALREMSWWYVVKQNAK